MTNTAVKSNVSFADFQKLDIRLGRVTEAERVEKSDKLLKLQVSFGDFTRQVVAGIGKTLEPKDLIGKQYLFVVNLEPAKLMGIESTAMIMATGSSESLGLFAVVESKYESIKLGHDTFADGSVVG